MYVDSLLNKDGPKVAVFQSIQLFSTPYVDFNYIMHFQSGNLRALSSSL